MKVEKMSISVPQDVAAAIRISAATTGLTLSAWMSRAAREQAAREESQLSAVAAAESLIVEYESTHGPIPRETWHSVDAFLDAADAAYGSAREASRAQRAG